MPTIASAGRRFAVSMIVGVAVALGIAVTSSAADYPVKPVRIVVPFVAGGVPDFITRVLAPGLGERLGQQVVVDNRPGAGGKVGTELAAAAEGDGYTLVIAGNSSFGITPALQGKKIRYDPVRSFAHLARVGESRAIIVVHPSFPVRSLADLVRLARQRPGYLNYGSSGNGTAPHLFGEMFKHHGGGLDIRHVPYRGGPQALAAIVAGEVEILVGQIAPVAPFLQAGRIRALAVSGSRRSVAVPDVPTFAEAGVKGMDSTVWYVYAAPAGTPSAVVAKLNAAFNALIADERVRAQLGRQGVETTPPMTPEAVRRFVADEVPRWAEAVRLSGAKVD